jgi:hypothetical protein
LKSKSRPQNKTNESDAVRASRRKAAARPDKALEFLRTWGLLLLQDPSFPSLVALIAGGAVKGSWWSHSKGSEIFHTAGALSDHPEVMTTKLISDKVTFVHRRLWPPLMAIGRAREPWQVSELTAAARSLLGRVDREGHVRASGLPARQLEKKLLVASSEVHTESGAHAIELMTWSAFAKQSRSNLPQISVVTAREKLSSLLVEMNGKFGCNGTLPW